MATKKISLSLKNINNWEATTALEAEISNNYRQDTKPPRVGWTINTIPSPEGIKSANLHHIDSNLLDLVYTFQPTPDVILDFDSISIFIDELGYSFYHIQDNIIKDRASWASYVYLAVADNNTALHKSMQYSGLPSNFNYILNNNSVVQNTTNIFLADGNKLVGADYILRNQGNNSSLVVLTYEGINPSNSTYVTKTTVQFTPPYANNLYKGFTSFTNYGIIWDTRDQMYTSEPSQIYNYNTSLTGSLARVNKISELRGSIVTIVPDKAGLMIYGTRNIVHAAYSGDANNPWIFTEVTGSSGLVTVDKRPMVSQEAENAAFHVALLERGLSIVSVDGVKPMPEALGNFINTDYLETKPIGSTTISKTTISTVVDAATLLQETTSKLKRIYLYGNDLFLCVGDSTTRTLNNRSLNRLYYFNFDTAKVGVIDGYCRNVVPYLSYRQSGTLNIDPNHHANGSFADSGVYLVSIKSLHISDPAQDRLRNYRLDLNGKSNIVRTSALPNQLDIRASEVFLTGVSISPDRFTEVLSIKLIGTTTDSNGTNRVRVFVYSKLQGATNPVEFIYYPKLDTYLGSVIGQDLQIELRGYYFDLSDCIIELTDGGIV